MAYEYAEPKQGMATWKKVLLIAVLAVALPVILIFAIAIYKVATESPEERFTRRIEADPTAAQFAKELKRLYPQEYVRFRLSVEARDREKSASKSSTDRSFVDGFVRRHRADAGKASDEALADYRSALLQVYDRAATNQPLCKTIISNSLEHIPETDKRSVEMLDRIAAVFVIAAASGRDQPTQRPAVSDADKLAFQKRWIAAGYTPNDLQRLGNMRPEATDRDPLKSCRLFQAMLRSISELPRDRAARLSAVIAEES